MASRNMVYVGRDRVQITPWKSSAAIANLVPFPARDAVTVETVRKTIDEIVTGGYESAFTSALTPSQAEPFFDAGFTLFEELHLLRRDLQSTPIATTHDDAARQQEGRRSPFEAVERGVTRRARRTDWDEVLELDGLAFDDFWRFDRNGLTDAIKATPRHRFQVIRTSPVAGYHVTGLAGSNSYVQRVAVHPEAQGQGYGTALVMDSLRWGWRNGAVMAQVNTQITNERAVALYERCGFYFAPYRLHVLRYDVTGAESDADTTYA